MTPTLSLSLVYSTAADTGHAKASAAKRLRSNRLLGRLLPISRPVFTNTFFIWPYNALHVEVTPDSSRMVGQPEVGTLQIRF
jgi:hypothetical protein